MVASLHIKKLFFILIFLSKNKGKYYHSTKSNVKKKSLLKLKKKKKVQNKFTNIKQSQRNILLSTYCYGQLINKYLIFLILVHKNHIFISFLIWIVFLIE